MSEILEKQKSVPPQTKVNQSYFELLAMIGDGLMGKVFSWKISPHYQVFQVRMKQTEKIYAMKVIPKKRVVEDKLASGTQTER